jgi:hypothetical protein
MKNAAADSSNIDVVDGLLTHLSVSLNFVIEIGPGLCRPNSDAEGGVALLRSRLDVLASCVMRFPRFGSEEHNATEALQGAVLKITRAFTRLSELERLPRDEIVTTCSEIAESYAAFLASLVRLRQVTDIPVSFLERQNARAKYYDLLLQNMPKVFDDSAPTGAI